MRSKNTRYSEEFKDLCQESKNELDDTLNIIDDYLDLSKKARRVRV